MIVSKANLDGIYDAFLAIFNNAMAESKTQWAQVAMEVPSTSRSNTYPFLDRVPFLQKWVGPKVVNNLKGQKYEIVNDDFEATLGVHKNDINDDNLGLFNPVVQQMGADAALLMEKLVFELLSDGFDTDCYDGQYFYDTDHDVAGSSVSNDGDTTALAHAAYNTARAAMQAFKSYDGKVLGVNPNLLIVPPALEKTAREIVEAEYYGSLSSGTGQVATNVLRNTATVMVAPWLKTTTEWHLLDTRWPLKPLIAQIRQKPEFIRQVDPATSTHVFLNGEYLYGVEARGAAGFGMWQMAYGSAGS